MEHRTRHPEFRFVGFLPVLVRWWVRLWARYRLAATAGVIEDLLVTVTRLEHPTLRVVTVSGELRSGGRLVIRATDPHVVDALAAALDLFVRRAAAGTPGSRSVARVSTWLETRGA